MYLLFINNANSISKQRGLFISKSKVEGTTYILSCFESDRLGVLNVIRNEFDVIHFSLDE